MKLTKNDSSIESLRRQLLPEISLPPELPITARADEIIAAILAHQVVIVCGETGSGKSTQLPKLCLSAGRGINGMIGHTQPRRLAARSLAHRITEELGPLEPPRVGFQIRFSARPPAETTLIKLMTDGVLLAEIQNDRTLSAYDTIIIDEAHERSLNIDFILGYLKRLLPKRPDLKVIITSATIDPEKFAHHFDDAPIIEVSGRGYPVEILYRPLEDESLGKDLPQAVLEGVEEINRLGRGDILVFLPSERVIRETADLLNQSRLSATRVLPLFGRLGIEDQMKVFARQPGRKIVLATNVAETSVTVPGIHYVIDSGLARISRYNHRHRMQRLPVELVSQASANQRAGRCGRIAPGVCLRLYAEEDYLKSSLFTDPEITRTPLAGVLLRMMHLGLGRIEDFPFIDPPDSRFIRQGYNQLIELNAMDDRGLTVSGRKMARLPIDPSVARMILAAAQNGCLAEVQIIASGLETQDPRDRPLDKQAQADEKHALFRDLKSDFLSMLNLWNAFNKEKEELSQSGLRKWCKAHFISFRRMREWEDVWRQLRSIGRNMKLRENSEPAKYAAIHQSLLTGLLANVAVVFDRSWYVGIRNVKLKPFPDSSLSKKRSKWLMAAELVQTHLTYARTAARIEAQWIEKAAAHLTREERFGPWWDSNSGRVRAYAKVTLYGLIINPKRRVDLSAVDPQQSRAILILDGLVEGDMGKNYPFLEHNQQLVDEIRTLECKFRRRDLLIEPEAIYALYEVVIPADIASRAMLERWMSRASAAESARLFFNRDDLLLQPPNQQHREQFPDYWILGDQALPLIYRLEPGADNDGISLVVSVANLSWLEPSALSWAVPGVWEEKVIEMIRFLPKAKRRRFVPAPDYAREVATRLEPAPNLFFSAAVAEVLSQIAGESIDHHYWADFVPSPHLLLRLTVINEAGHEMSSSRDIDFLRRKFLSTDTPQHPKKPSKFWPRDKVKEWVFPEIPVEQTVVINHVKSTVYPSLVCVKGGFAIEHDVLRERAEQKMTEALFGLIRTMAARETRQLTKSREMGVLQLKAVGLPCSKALVDDLLHAVFARAYGDVLRPLPRTASQFDDVFKQGRRQLQTAFNDYVPLLEQTLDEARAALSQLAKPALLGEVKVHSELKKEVEALFVPNFISEVSMGRLAHFPRYLKAIQARLEKLKRNPKRDNQRAALLYPYLKRFKEWSALHPERWSSDEVQTVRWLIEEWRVSIFSQELGTAESVSEKKVSVALERLLQPVCKF